MAVAIDHGHGFKPTIRNRRHRLRSFPHPDINLLDLDPFDPTQLAKKSPTAATSSFHRSFSTPSQLAAAKSEEAASPDHLTRVEIIGGRRAYGVYALVVEAAIAMASGAQPVPASGGLGGAYYLHSRAGESFAVVKPIDEEPMGSSNSNGFPGSVIGQPGFRRSIRAGETGLREVAAYLLDHGGFSCVPPTALVKMSHPAFHVNPSALPRKIASIQRFVAHDFDAGDLGPSRFSVSSVHRIGILDVRLLNIDRHAGNILVKKSSGNGNGSDGYGNGGPAAAELVPIDHGFCLPELVEDPYFEWLHWPQAAVPFSEPETEYISALDPYKDAELLRTELPLLREASIRILVLCTVFLKQAAAAGLCLAEIGDMMTREFCGLEEGPSVLEILCKEVQDGMDSTLSPKSDDHGETQGAVAGDEPEESLFDMDCDDEDGGGFFSETHVEQVVEIPRLLQGRPPKVPNSTPRKLKIRSRSGDSLKDPVEESGGDGRTDEAKVGGLTKSVSFSSPAGGGHEFGGGTGMKCVTFRGMSEVEWKMFLEKFEEHLPEAFAVRKSLGLKHRLGTSCKF